MEDDIKLGRMFAAFGWDNCGLAILDSGDGEYFNNMVKFIIMLCDGEYWEDITHYVNNLRKLPSTSYNNWANINSMFEENGDS